MAGSRSCQSGRDQAPLRQCIDVGAQGQRHHIRLQPIQNGTCLGAGTAMRLVDLDALPGLILPSRDKGSVQVTVKLTGWIV